MSEPLRLALLQCEPLPLDVAGNLRRLRAAALHAAGEGADLLVCPEMFVTGYAIGADAVRRLAEPRDGTSAQAVAGIAREAGLAIAYGYPESNATAAAPFNAAQFIDRQGRPCGHYRKTHLFGGLDRAQFSAGDAAAEVAAGPAVARPPFAVFEWRGWRIGLLICYDIEFPEPARALALAGGDLIVVPTANMRTYDVVSRTLVPARAYESQVYVAYANYCGAEPGAQAGGPIDYGGLSTVAGPNGTAIALAAREPLCLLADLDHAALQASRAALPYLADRRPGLYRKI